MAHEWFVSLAFFNDKLKNTDEVIMMKENSSSLLADQS
jgi:hypothetical protein